MLPITMPSTGGSESSPDTANEMFRKAMRGEWRSVAKIYATLKGGQDAVIIQTGDTLLHLAVSSRKQYNVSLLLDCITVERNRDILAIGNKSGDTPLHLAAALGMSAACWDMANRCPELVTQARNSHGETPIFKAARYGRMNAFYAMRLAASAATNLGFRRNFGGDTILHVALLGEHYDLALEIIQIYPSLVELCNEKGELPIHILANKPSSFKSGAHFKGLLDHLIYHSTSLDPLVLCRGDRRFPEYRPRRGSMQRALLRSVIRAFWTIGEGETGRVRRIFHMSCVVPYCICVVLFLSCMVLFGFFRLAMRFLLYVTGISELWMRAIEMRKLKKIHVRARQIMIELLKCESTEWDFGNTGRRPGEMTGDWLGIPGQPPHAVQDEPAPATLEPDGLGHGDSSQHAPSNSAPVEGRSNISYAFSRSPFDVEIDFGSNRWRRLFGCSASLFAVLASPILLAAKNGIKELVEYVLEHFPVALFDLDSNGKNILLLAVEHRQSHIYELMLKKKEMQQSVFGISDNEGNSAAHLAAKCGPDQPQIIPGEALRMQWEVKWFKYVERSMDPEFFARYNNKGETAREIFTTTHKKLVEDGSNWLTKTSKSCSVVAALIATMAFTAASSLTTWGVDQNSGSPFLLQSHRYLQVFSVSAVVALCFSVTSLALFLSFLTCRYEQWDFETDLPLKLILNLTSLYLSLTATAVCFFAGYAVFAIKQKSFNQYPLFVIVLLPIYTYGAPQIPLYFGLIKATFTRVPERASTDPGKRYVR